MASSPKDPKQQKTKPIRRNDVIHCENCGEDYSVTYKPVSYTHLTLPTIA